MWRSKGRASATKADSEYRGDSGRKAGCTRHRGELPPLSRYAHIGLEWAGTVAIFAGIGFFLDRRWDLFPWLTIGGAAVGIGGGTYHFLKSVSRDEKH